MTEPEVPSDEVPVSDAPVSDAPGNDPPGNDPPAMEPAASADPFSDVAEDWDGLGVRAEAVDEWRALGANAFVAALAQGDGYGPVSARHVLGKLQEIAETWREAGLASAEGLRWHRAGFAAAEASEWQRRGVDLDEAALAAGHRMVG